MSSAYQKGALLRTFVEGRDREVVIDYITSNGRLAQCYWLEQGNKRFVTISLRIEPKGEPALRSHGTA